MQVGGRDHHGHLRTPRACDSGEAEACDEGKCQEQWHGCMTDGEHQSEQAAGEQA